MTGWLKFDSSQYNCQLQLCLEIKVRLDIG